MTDEENIQTTPSEIPIFESNSAPVGPDEPTKQAPIPPTESAPADMPPEASQASPSPEEAVPVKDANFANEPLNPAPEPASEPKENTTENPNIALEKHGTDTTITEVMQPKTEPENGTAQLPPNEPLADWQAEKRTANLKLANETRLEKKREKIEKILELFSDPTSLKLRGTREITNDEVEKLLHVSDATATRYLKQLESENKIRQVGKTGKGVKYQRI